MVKLVAEFCANHMGNIDIARQMIDVLAKFPSELRVDVIKFQKRCPRVILSEQEYNAPHPDSKNSFGKTYGLHKEFLEFNIEQHRELKSYCEANGFIYSSSVFDRISAEEIISLHPEMIKISSANNTDYELLEFIDNNFDGEIHISLGMTTKEEESRIFDVFQKKKKNLVLYACTSSYPTTSGNICLLEIRRLNELYGKYIKAVGFSGHHAGNLYDIAALTLGAEYIERHFTLDKTFKGTDQLFSLNAADFMQLSKDLKLVEKDLVYKPKDVLDDELLVRERLKYKGVVCR